MFKGLKSSVENKTSLIFLLSSVSRESTHTERCFRNAQHLDHEKHLVLLVRNIEMPLETVVRWLNSLDGKF